MTKRWTRWFDARPPLLAAFLALDAGMSAHAEEIPGVAGEWKVEFPGGAVHVYKIDRRGRVSGTAEGKAVTGRAARQNDNSTHLKFHGKDRLERLSLNSPDEMAVAQFDHASDYPSKPPARTGTGARRAPAAGIWESEPDAKVGELAGQWAVPYLMPTGEKNTWEYRGMVREYEFDAKGNMRGREGDRALSGHLSTDEEGNVLAYGWDVRGEKGRLRVREGGRAPVGRASRGEDGCFLLALDGLDEVEALSLRADGRLDVLHWPSRADLGVTTRSATATATPVAGASRPGVELLDVPMLDTLFEVGCSGAAITVARGDHVYYSRGYGWSDYERTVRLRPDNPMAVGSCIKPPTAAMTRQLLAAHHLPVTTGIMRFFDVKPVGPVVDRRVWDIRIQDVIYHKAGWQGEPFLNAFQAYNGQKRPASSAAVLPYIAAGPLAFTPGSKEEYDNYGYDVLTHVVMKLSRQHLADYLRDRLCQPYGVEELKTVRGHDPRPGEPPPVWNVLTTEDLPEQHMAISMPGLCTFMSHFWYDGVPRDHRHLSQNKNGGNWNAMALCIWRPDGINVAFAFNGPGDDDHGKQINAVVDQLVAQGKIPAR